MLGSRPVSVHSDYPGGSATFKTPGRALHQNRAENATAAARTAGKNVFQTPFKQPLGGGTTTPFPRKDGGDAGGKTALRTGARPLGDKTPFPNRPRRSGEGIMQTPFALAPIALDFVPGLTPAPASTCRPSSVRKSTRRSSRGSTGLNLSGIGSALDLGVFQTPRVNGNPWDVEDIDVVLPSTEDKIDEEPDEDDDEIEYMPPKAVELAYEPPFEMPNYTELGKALFNFSHVTLDEPVAAPFTDADIDRLFLETPVPDIEILTPIDDTPFFFSSLLEPTPTPAKPALATKTNASSRSMPRSMSETSKLGNAPRPVSRTVKTAVKSSSSLLATNSLVVPRAPSATKSTPMPFTRAPSATIKPGLSSRAVTGRPPPTIHVTKPTVPVTTASRSSGASAARLAPSITGRPRSATATTRPAQAPPSRPATSTSTLRPTTLTTRPATSMSTSRPARSAAPSRPPKLRTVDDDIVLLFPMTLDDVPEFELSV